LLLHGRAGEHHQPEFAELGLAQRVEDLQQQPVGGVLVGNDDRLGLGVGILALGGPDGLILLADHLECVAQRGDVEAVDAVALVASVEAGGGELRPVRQEHDWIWVVA
jgi:hypothetical protein